VRRDKWRPPLWPTFFWAAMSALNVWAWATYEPSVFPVWVYWITIPLALAWTVGSFWVWRRGRG
jgi:hypothetical protein